MANVIFSVNLILFVVTFGSVITSDFEPLQNCEGDDEVSNCAFNTKKGSETTKKATEFKKNENSYCPTTSEIIENFTEAPRESEICNFTESDRKWVQEKIKLMWRIKTLNGITPIDERRVKFNENITIFFKNEGKSFTGSIKHRYSWSLIMWALTEGYIGPRTVIYEASSGNTAFAEAYFCNILGIHFVAVVHENTSSFKIKMIERYGAKVIKTPGIDVEVAQKLCHEDPNGFFMNQLVNSEKAIIYAKSSGTHSSGNIAEEFLTQLNEIGEKPPKWAVFNAGSGGTATAVMRYFKRNNIPTKFALVDPEESVIFDWLRTGQNLNIKKLRMKSKIEGIGRQTAVIFGETFSLLRYNIDRAFKVPDAASIGGMHFLLDLLKFQVGASTGTNFFGVLKLAIEMTKNGENGSIFMPICDLGERYQETYWNDDFSDQEFPGWRKWKQKFSDAWNSGILE